MQTSSSLELVTEEDRVADADQTGTTEEASKFDLAETKQDPFAFSLDDLHADAVAAVDNPVVRAAILRVKQGKVEQGFTHAYNRAYHSHTRT